MYPDMYLYAFLVNALNKRNKPIMCLASLYIHLPIWGQVLPSPQLLLLLAPVLDTVSTLPPAELTPMTKCLPQPQVKQPEEKEKQKSSVLKKLMGLYYLQEGTCFH